MGILCEDAALNSARPIQLSGSCKRESAEEHLPILQDTLTALRRTRDSTRMRIVSLASDGEARRARVLIDLCYRFQLKPDSPIHPMLAGLELMDLYVGEDDLTADKDNKHVFKRCRNPFLSLPKSIPVCSVRVTNAQLRRHMLDVGHSLEHVNSVLNPRDKHDVLLAFRLLRDMWSMPSADPTTCTASYVETRQAIRIYGDMCYHLVFPYICTDLSLEEQLEHLGAVVHLAVALFAHHSARTEFLGIALIVDMSISVLLRRRLSFPSFPSTLFCLETTVSSRSSAFFALWWETSPISISFS